MCCGNRTRGRGGGGDRRREIKITCAGDIASGLVDASLPLASVRATRPQVHGGHMHGHRSRWWLASCTVRDAARAANVTSRNHSRHGVARATSRLHPPRLHPPRLHPPRLHPPRLHPPRLHPPRLHPPPPHLEERRSAGLFTECHLTHTPKGGNAERRREATRGRAGRGLMVANGIGAGAGAPRVPHRCLRWNLSCCAIPPARMEQLAHTTK